MKMSLCSIMGQKACASLHINICYARVTIARQTFIKCSFHQVSSSREKKYFAHDSTAHRVMARVDFTINNRCRKNIVTCKRTWGIQKHARQSCEAQKRDEKKNKNEWKKKRRKKVCFKWKWNWIQMKEKKKMYEVSRRRVHRPPNMD